MQHYSENGKKDLILKLDLVFALSSSGYDDFTVTLRKKPNSSKIHTRLASQYSYVEDVEAQRYRPLSVPETVRVMPLRYGILTACWRISYE